MLYVPATSYDKDLKIWSGDEIKEYFAPNLSIGEIIFHEMRRHPKLIAQISTTEETILTREELHWNAMHVASYMRSRGLLQSDIVGIIARNTTHIPAVAYGCFFNGIAFHSLNIAYDRDTIEKLFSITRPRIIFCDGDEYEIVREATQHLENVEIVTMRNHPEGGSTPIQQILSSPIEDNFLPVRLEQGIDQTLAILCSSGTTGTPKAVTLTNSRKILAGCHSLTTSDVQYTYSSLDWISGVLTTITSGVYSTTRIITDNVYDPVYLLRLIEDRKITWTLQAPSHMAMMVNCPEFESTDFSSIRYFLFGGGRASVETQKLIRSRLSRDGLIFMYGLTELGAMATMNVHFDEKPNSVGRLLSGLKAKIVSEEGESLDPDELGEVCIRNGQHWAGYYGNQQETRKIRDPQLWFHTGDLGYMDYDGFLYIVERKKDMLKYLGMMYYPNDIETIISEMPEVAEVCVFGVWDQVNGDEAVAAVVKRQGKELKAQDIVDYVRDHTEVKYKQLNGGAIIMEELKRSPNGKTNRIATKEYFLNIKGRQ